jgi:NAD(P)-dependent dehydrogenase (short-subunit alcohol dehydrogenase family)
MGKLDDKVVVITGGASGIGRATVRLFVKEGAQVVFGDIEDRMAKRVADEVGTNATYLHADVNREEDIKALVDYATEKLGRLDCMFNNAGAGGAQGLIEDVRVEDWDMTINLLLRSVFLGIKHAARVMKTQGFGSIINTASVAGIQTGFGHHAYSSCKAAIIHLTRTTAVELGASGVRVNCICPGGIATAIFGRGFGLSAEDADNAAELLKPVFTKLQPIKRAGLPEDIAQAALWLASDDAGFVSGHALVIDGGLTGGREWIGKDPELSPMMAALMQAFASYIRQGTKT